MVHQVGDECARSGGWVEDIDVLVGQRLAEVILQQPVGAPYDEVHHLVGRVHHAEAVSGAGVVSLVEVLVDGFQELLLLAVLGDVISGATNGTVVRPQPVYGLAAHVAGEKGALKGIQLAGNVVLAVELVLTENTEEDVLGQDVLD